MKITENLDLSNYMDVNTCDYFLTMERISVDILSEELISDGVISDYTLLSISPVLKWILGKVETLRIASGNFNDIEYTSHINGEIDNLILHAAYYMGESYIRSTKSLKWDKTPEGDSRFPAVIGFKHDFRMYPVDEVNRICEKISNKNSKPIEHHIDTTVLEWLIRLK